MQTDYQNKMTTLDVLVTPSPRSIESLWRLEPIEITEDTSDTSQKHVYSHVSVHPSGDFVTFRRRSIFPTVLTTELLGYDPSTGGIRKLLEEEIKLTSSSRFIQEVFNRVKENDLQRYGDFSDYAWISDTLLVAASIVFPDDLERWSSVASACTSSNIPEIPRRLQLTAYDFKTGGRKRYDFSRMIIEQSRGEWIEYHGDSHNGDSHNKRGALGINTFNGFHYDSSEGILRIRFDSHGCDHSNYNSASLRFTPNGDVDTLSYHLGETRPFADKDVLGKERIPVRNEGSIITLRRERNAQCYFFHLEEPTNTCAAFRLNSKPNTLSVTDCIKTPEGFSRDKMPYADDYRNSLLLPELDIVSLSNKTAVLCLYGRPYLLKAIE